MNYKNLFLYNWLTKNINAKNNRELYLKYLSGKNKLNQSEQTALEICLNNINESFIIVFDTETTGLSKQDQIIQLGFVIYSNVGRLIYEHERLLPTTHPINHYAHAQHKISHDMLQKSNIDTKHELEFFCKLLKKLQKSDGLLVAHNLSFDFRMLMQTCATFFITKIPKTRTFCTLKNLRMIKFKSSLKNEEVYKSCGGNDSGSFHTALFDAKATGHVYFYGKKHQWWS